jgi:hypothetical protein
MKKGRFVQYILSYLRLGHATQPNAERWSNVGFDGEPRLAEAVELGNRMRLLRLPDDPSHQICCICLLPPAVFTSCSDIHAIR